MLYSTSHIALGKMQDKELNLSKLPSHKDNDCYEDSAIIPLLQVEFPCSKEVTRKSP